MEVVEHRKGKRRQDEAFRAVPNALSHDFGLAPAVASLYRRLEGAAGPLLPLQRRFSTARSLPSAAALVPAATKRSGFSAAALLYSPGFLLFHLLSVTTTPYMVSHLIRARRAEEFEAALERWVDECSSELPPMAEASSVPSSGPSSATSSRFAERVGPLGLSQKANAFPGTRAQRAFGTSARNRYTAELVLREPEYDLLPTLLDGPRSNVAFTSAELSSASKPSPSYTASNKPADAPFGRSWSRLRQSVNAAKQFSPELLWKARKMMEIANRHFEEMSPSHFNHLFVALRHVQRLQIEEGVAEDARRADQRLDEAWRGKAAAWQVDRWRTAHGLAVHQSRFTQVVEAVESDLQASDRLSAPEREAALATLLSRLPSKSPERPDLLADVDPLSDAAFKATRPLCACQRPPRSPTLLSWPDLNVRDLWPLAFLLGHRERGTHMSAETWLRGVDIALTAKRVDLAALMLAAGPGEGCSSERQAHRGLVFDSSGNTNRQLRQEKELADAIQRSPLEPMHLFAVRLALEQILQRRERGVGNGTAAVPARWLAIFDACLDANRRTKLPEQRPDSGGLQLASDLLGRELLPVSNEALVTMAAQCLDLMTTVDGGRIAYEGANDRERLKIFVLLVAHCAKRKSSAEVQAILANQPPGLDTEAPAFIAASIHAAARHPDCGTGSDLVKLLDQKLFRTHRGALNIAEPDVHRAAVTAILDFAFRPGSSKDRRRAVVHALFPGAFEFSEGMRDGRVRAPASLPPLPSSPWFYAWLLQRVAGSGDTFLGGQVIEIAKAARGQSLRRRGDGETTFSWNFPIAFHSAALKLLEAASNGDEDVPRGPLFRPFRPHVSWPREQRVRSSAIGWLVRDLAVNGVIAPLQAMDPEARSKSDLRPDRQFYRSLATALISASRRAPSREVNIQRLERLIADFSRLGFPFPSDIMRSLAEDSRSVQKSPSASEGPTSEHRVVSQPFKGSTIARRCISQRLRDARKRMRHGLKQAVAGQQAARKPELHQYLDRLLSKSRELERSAGRD